MGEQAQVSGAKESVGDLQGGLCPGGLAGGWGPQMWHLLTPGLADKGAEFSVGPCGFQGGREAPL